MLNAHCICIILDNNTVLKSRRAPFTERREDV
jgi:hypothetical protein